MICLTVSGQTLRQWRTWGWYPGGDAWESEAGDTDAEVNDCLLGDNWSGKSTCGSSSLSGGRTLRKINV